jgi:hypothetical protein
MLLFTGALWNWHPHVVGHTPACNSVAIAGRYPWFESTSLQQRGPSLSRTRFRKSRTPAFRAAVAAGLAAGSAETRRGFDIAPTGGNISAGPYSSTAVPVTVVGENTMPVPTKSGLLRGQRAVDRQISEFGSGSSKAEHDPLIVPGKRQT